MTKLKQFFKKYGTTSFIFLLFFSAAGLGLYLPNRQTKQVNELTLIDRQQILEKEAEKLIKQLEASYSEENRLAAQSVIDELKMGKKRHQFQARIDALKQKVTTSQAAEASVKHLEDNQTEENLVPAQNAVNQVTDDALKSSFQNRINAVSAAIDQRKKAAEAERHRSQEVTQYETIITIEPEVVETVPTPAPEPVQEPEPTPSEQESATDGTESTEE